MNRDAIAIPLSYSTSGCVPLLFDVFWTSYKWVRTFSHYHLVRLIMSDSYFLNHAKWQIDVLCNNIYKAGVY